MGNFLIVFLLRSVSDTALFYMAGPYKWSAFFTFSNQHPPPPMLCTFDCHVQFFLLHFAGDQYISAVIAVYHELEFSMDQIRKFCGFLVSVLRVTAVPVDMQHVVFVLIEIMLFSVWN
jgi:hypothetical protein